MEGYLEGERCGQWEGTLKDLLGIVANKGGGMGTRISIASDGEPLYFDVYAPEPDEPDFDYSNLSPQAKALMTANEDLWNDWDIDVTEWGSPKWYEKMAQYMTDRGWTFEEIQDEPPFDEIHHLYHAPNRPHEGCANCKWLNWLKD